MTWGMVAVAGAGLVGGAMASSSAKKSAQTAADAANYMNKLKEPYVTQGWGQAQGALNDSLKLGNAYNGQRVAQLQEYQTQGANAAGDFALNQGAQGANTLFGAGNQMLGAGQSFGGNAQGLYARAGQDPTQQILANAGQYANNPYVNGMIDASNRDVARSLNEQALPSLARSAAGSGNTNSTRAGVESAIAQRGAADRMADTASNIRSQFFNQGLQQSQAQYNQNFQNQLNANGQLQGAYGLGTNSLLQSQQMGANNFDMSQAAGGVYQNFHQQNLDADHAKWNEQRTGNLDLISRYLNTMGEVGQYQAPAQTPTAMQGALGGAMAGAGLYGKLGNFQTAQPTQPTAYNPYALEGYGNTQKYNDYAPTAVANGGWGIE